MLKFILLVIVFSLVMRFAMRIVARLLRGKIFSFYKSGFDRAGNSPPSFSSGEQLEEADFEVIESHLNDKERDVT
ncbi:MAG: hypothetical protein ACOYOE_10260 [Chlorobium sp.]